MSMKNSVVHSNYYPGLEVLRGVAACLVVIHHAYDLSNSQSTRFGWLFESFGSTGVIVFFVLSAFLLSTGLLRTGGKSIKKFYIRRFFRIAPAYYFVVIVLYVFFASPENIYSRQGFWQSLANLLFLQLFSPDTVSNLNVNGALWTLSIEAILYFALPFIIFLVSRSSWISISMFFTVGYVFRIMVQHGIFNEIYFHKHVLQPNQMLYIQQQFLGWLPIFCGGISIAVVFLNRPPTLQIQFRTWYLVFLFLPTIAVSKVVFSSSSSSSLWFTNYDIFIGLTVTAMVYILASFNGISTSIASKVGLYLGQRSYGIYLWHFPILLSVFARGPQESTHFSYSLPQRLVIAIVLIFIFAEISYRFVEIPMINRGKQIIQSLSES